MVRGEHFKDMTALRALSVGRGAKLFRAEGFFMGFYIASSLRLISLRSHPIFELALKKVDTKLCTKFQHYTSNSFFRNRNTKYVIAFILRARYASFHFARTPSLNLHLRKWIQSCVQNFNSIRRIVFSEIETQNIS